MSEQNKVRDGLNPNAHRVFKGVIFEVWQWDQKMFDGTTQVFERIWRAPTVEVIATVGDKILIQEEDQPNRLNNINFPGGRADQGSDIIQEAKRELLEETGYASNDWSVLLRHGKDKKVMHEVYYLVARNCEKAGEPHLDAGERIKSKFITFDELIDLSEEPRFWTSPEFLTVLLRARYDQGKKEELRKQIFGE